MFFLIFILYIIKTIITQQNIEINKKLDDPNFLFNSNPIFTKFSEEWSQKMQNFVSQYIYTITINKRTQVKYYENITKVTYILQGAFILEEAKNEKEIIDFKIVSPNKTVIFQSSDIASIFSIQINEKGLYTFQFNNKNINREVRPTFIVNSGQNNIKEKENLSKTEQKLEKIVAFLQKYDQERRLTRGSTRRGNTELKKTNNYFYAFSFIETVVLIAVSVWQYFYLKHLFEIKGSL